MEEIKTAKCIGVRDIVSVNVECPYCEHEIQIPYNEFVENAGEPWGEEHVGHSMVCPACEVYFELGEFEMEE